jgi:hypothetical protein
MSHMRRLWQPRVSELCRVYRHRLWAALLLATFAFPLQSDFNAQARPSVRITPDRVVTASLPARPIVEPHLAAHPKNAQHLVGAVMISVRDRADLMQTRCAAVATFDGGRTWVSHTFDVPRCYDPWAAVLDDGTAIFVGLETDNDGAVPHMWLYRSPDGGRMWPDAPHSFGRAHDHPTIAIDRSGGRFHGALYVASTKVVRDPGGRVRTRAFVARSMDGGRTFATIEHELMNLLTTITSSGVLPGGGLLVLATTNQRYVPDNRGSVPLRNRLYWAIRSEDGGQTFGVPMLISDACAGGAGKGWPAMGIDVTKFRPGRSYALCHDQRGLGPFLMRSDDEGDRWTDPLAVPPSTPPGASDHRQNANLAINHEGVVAISWNDRGADASSKCWNVMLSLSHDGGQTFDGPHQVSTAPSCPATAENGYAQDFFPFGGHYSGLAAAADGAFHLLWSDSRGLRYELRTAQAVVAR